jgi:hypothetical protein
LGIAWVVLVDRELVAIEFIQSPFCGKPEEALPILQDGVHRALRKALLGGDVLKSDGTCLGIHWDAEYWAEQN